jgi:hypothetical protein
MVISKEKQLYYLIILVLTLVFFNTAYIPTISFVVGITVALAFIYYDTKTTDTSVSNINKELHYKLASLLKYENLRQPQYFYIYPDIINFFYDISDFRIYNRDAYVKAIKNTDNLLKIKKELENDYSYTEISDKSPWQNFGYVSKSKIKSNITNHKAMFQSAEVLANKSINNIHSFVISLPSAPIVKKKHTKALEKFHILTKRILDDILIKCKNGSTDPLIGQDYGLPKPGNKNNTTFDFINL